MRYLLKIIPECFLSLFCNIIKKSKFFHLIHQREKFIIKYFNKFPGDVFENCSGDPVYLKQISLSLINWNNHLLKVFFECKIDILYLVALFYAREKYKFNFDREKVIKKVRSILTSNIDNKFDEYVQMVKNCYFF